MSIISESRQNELWDKIDDILDELGVSEFYVPETLPEEDALKLFIKAMDKFGPNKVIEVLEKLNK